MPRAKKPLNVYVIDAGALGDAGVVYAYFRRPPAAEGKLMAKVVLGVAGTGKSDPASWVRLQLELGDELDDDDATRMVLEDIVAEAVNVGVALGRKLEQADAKKGATQARKATKK